MGKIKILDREVADIIAAGEVVENTASLVKELLENSLDAGASEIIIKIDNGARDISISDNGDGMSLDDLQLCIYRHATSKIKNKEDLFALNTYGFRGEALSSITAISKSTIESSEGSSGHRIYIESGDIVGQEIADINKGTKIEVKDLFYNVPARLKFMRSLNNEYSKIKDIVLKEALVNPKVSISLYINGEVKLRTTGNGIKNTILELFNSNTLKNLNNFDLGFLGNSSLQKSNRNGIYTFFNNRYAKSAMVDKAIIDAYYTKVDKGRYPFVILFFNIDPKEIDVNVHPSKKIVKFKDEQAIYKYVYGKVKKYLESIDRVISSNVISNSYSIDEIKEDINNSKIDADKNINRNIYSSDREDILSKIDAVLKSSVSVDMPTNKLANEQKIIDKDEEDYFVSNRFVGQIFRSFSVVECSGKLEIYDNHIVQERILYEEIKDKYYSKAIVSQHLLVPIRVALSKLDYEKAVENISFFSSFGFEVDIFNKEEILLRRVPVFNFKDSYENIVRDLIDLLGSEIRDIREEAIITMSCRQSIKAGDNVTDQEMKRLISKLHKLKKYSCPHGRNIIVDIDKSYILKQFKR